MSAPGFVFYPGDYFRDTRGLETVEHGAYMLLLLSLYAEGGRLDKARLPRLAGLKPKAFESVWAQIGRFFYEDGEAIGHRRVDRELAKQKKLSETRAAVARGGHKTRKKAAKKAAKNEGAETRNSEKTEDKQAQSSAIAEQMQVTLTEGRVLLSDESKKPYLSAEGEDALARLLDAAARAPSLGVSEIRRFAEDVRGFHDGALIVGGAYALARYSQSFASPLRLTGLRLSATEDPPGGNVVRLAKAG